MRTGQHSIGWVTMIQIHFIKYQNIFISNIIDTVVSQRYFKPLFHLVRFFTKIIGFDNVKFPANMSSEDGV